MRYAFRPGIPAWAREFDEWAADALSRFDVDALQDFRARAPAAQQALPTWEHFAPVLVAAGAAAGDHPCSSAECGADVPPQPMKKSRTSSTRTGSS